MKTSQSRYADERYAVQRRLGFPWLRFLQDLEIEYRKAYTDVITPRIRFGGTLGVLAILLFVFIDQVVGVDYSTPGADGVLIGICVPAAGFPLIASFYERAHPYLLKLSALGVLGVSGGVLYTIILAREGQMWAPYESLLLVTVYIFFVSGLLYFQAIFCGLALLVAFAVTNYPLQQHTLLTYEVLHLFLANVVGWIGLYLLDHQTRMEFLLKRELEQIAVLDSLTGLVNRRAFTARIETIWKQAKRNLSPVGLMLLDIDEFKQVNDACGHQFGDDALVHVGNVLKGAALRPLDIAARYGGDEFIAVWYEVDGVWFAKLAEEMPQRLAGLSCGAPDNPLKVTVSGGAVLAWPRPGMEPRDAIKAADQLLYESKRNKRGSIGYTVMRKDEKKAAA